MKHKAIVVALGLAGLIGTQAARAEVTYSFSGFGTLGATHSDTREADYRGSILQPNGPGRSSPTMFGVDTKLGGQAIANLGNGFSATVQVVADHRADNSYQPQFEWANLKYQINDTWYVRAGRVVAPVFMVSDYRNVGYSQITVRPPYELYMLNPITHLDGGDVGAKFDVAGGTLAVQASGGRFKVVVKSRVESPAILVTGTDRNINLTYERGASTFRAGFNRTVNDSKSDEIAQLDMLLGYGRLVGYPTPNADLHHIKATLLDLGYVYDDGAWIGQAEYVQGRAEGPAVQDTDAWSAMLGYRVGKWTPYGAYTRMTSKEPPLRYPPATADPSSPLYPLLSRLASSINQFDTMVNTHYQQHTMTLGARWDLFKNVALKAQWDRTFKPSMRPGLNRGAFTHATTAFTEGAYTVNLYTMTLDFVF